MSLGIYQHESATSTHVSPDSEYFPCHLPPYPIPPGCLRALALGALLHLFYIWKYTFFNAILSNHPTLSFSHRIQMSVLYIYVSFAALHKDSHCHFSKFNIYALIYIFVFLFLTYFTLYNRLQFRLPY